MHMRSALCDCIEQVERLRGLLNLRDAQDVKLFQSACVATDNIEQEREIGLRRVHEKLSRSFGGGDEDDLIMCPIDVVRVDKNGWYREGNGACNISSTYSNFKKEYCFRNVPCIIRGLDEINFEDISLNWKRKNTDTTDATRGESRINTSWFETYVGEDTMVPVRIDRDNGLDKDGRAEECTTKMMRLKDWITSCRRKRIQGEICREYLKDWHLLQLLRSKQPADAAAPLYKTPQFFERDLLNNFLERYSDCDFKFVYWGPSGSITRLHSDVLHSFSFSYNVTGAKRWTFYIPNSPSDVKTTRSFDVIQKEGETMFVPSMWMHEVVNLVETLSINHNWITSANIDNTWQCISNEIKAIDSEIRAWGTVPSDDFEAREMMLRGCAGLDVTTFFLMILLEVSELLVQVLGSANDVTVDSNDNHDSMRSICYLVKVLRDVSSCQEAKAAERLQAVLGSKTRAIQAQECASFVVDLVTILKENHSADK
jgi:hypothetical protein